jgi:hypothetical protein
MTGNGIAVVPRALASDSERGFALLSWVEGDVVADPTEPDIDAAAAFLEMTHALCRAEGAARQPLGAEACLSGAEIVAQLGRRLAALGVIQNEPALLGFSIASPRCCSARCCRRRWPAMPRWACPSRNRCRANRAACARRISASTTRCAVRRGSFLSISNILVGTIRSN